ncbi:hypothetical protein DICVIV_01741 [Dictyocaulus viviparus]|uniref:Uncharacterized protein n=1 Tax=Dictyocaulus viviparus TaxID=29172 RepID=A0A0D8Y5M4_DICVI|nr:hypothetical protein DICVIV_01741 [Dictyocaulus viviparus]
MEGLEFANVKQSDVKAASILMEKCVSLTEIAMEIFVYSVQQIIRPNGMISVRKTCLNSGLYQFSDGMTITSMNQCVTRTLPDGYYYVMMCSSGDECNSNCITTTMATTVMTTSRPLPGNVLCYDCISYNGTDCQSNVCEGKFCIYERKVTGKELMMRKSCTDTPLIILDNSISVHEVGVCEVRNTLTSQYFVNICDNFNFCNNYCNPEVTTSIPQKQPFINCYNCESYAGECFTGKCTAQYCFYERQRRQPNGLMYIKKSCSNLPFIEYPDKSLSMTLNACEIRLMQGVQYQVFVCDMIDNCNAACPVTNRTLINCYDCEISNQNDCTTGICQGSYCIFSKI